MNKNLLLAILTTIVVGCTSEQENQFKTFGYEIVEEGSMTRGTAMNAVKYVCNSTKPSALTLSFSNSKNTYEIVTGESYDVKTGAYVVTGEYDPNTSEALSFLNGSVKSDVEPFIKVDTSINITADKDTYTIPATYDCFGIVTLESEVGGMYFYEEGGSYNRGVNTASRDNYAITFVKADLLDKVLEIKILNRLSKHKDTSFLFSDKSGRDDCIKPQKGKYYLLHPAPIDDVSATSNYEVVDWEEIEL